MKVSDFQRTPILDLYVINPHFQFQIITAFLLAPSCPLQGAPVSSGLGVQVLGGTLSLFCSDSQAGGGFLSMRSCRWGPGQVTQHLGADVPV